VVRTEHGATGACERLVIEVPENLIGTILETIRQSHAVEMLKMSNHNSAACA